MHDIKAIRENPALYVQGWSSRGLSVDVDALIDLDRRLRAAKTAGEAALAAKNAASREVGILYARANRDLAEEGIDADYYFGLAEQKKREAGELGQAAIAAAEAEIRRLKTELDDALAALPNIPDVLVPYGLDEQGNKQQGPVFGDPCRLNNPRDHVDLGAGLGGMDFEAAAKMSGSRFVVLKKGVARLERALGQFMLDLQTEQNGYQEVSPPLLVKAPAMFGTGQLPKFADDLFSTSDVAFRAVHGRDFESDLLVWAKGGAIDFANADLEKHYRQALEDGGRPSFHRLNTSEMEFVVTKNRYLIPTAEVSLTNLVREAITSEEDLPLRLTALTHCFRSEAGSAGRDTRGMIRQHQFQKVELVSIATPEQSAAEHDHMVASAQMVLEKLGLSYRTMLLCTGDMGFSAKKTFDLEVWLPSQNTFREISSISNCGDFQARRMDARCQKKGEKGTRYMHTLNGSGLAVGRTLVAVLENYQDEGGRIAIPDVLVPYMGGVTHLEPQA